MPSDVKLQSLEFTSLKMFSINSVKVNLTQGFESEVIKTEEGTSIHGEILEFDCSKLVKRVQGADDFG